MSKIEVNEIVPQSGTTLTLGGNGDTLSIASGVTSSFPSLTVSGDLTIDTNTLYVDSTNNRVGIGTSSVSANLQVTKASSGASSLLTSSTVSLFENSGNTDIVIGAGNTSKSRIGFGDNGDAFIGRIDYDHSDNSMRFGTGGSGERMRITAGGNVGIGTSSPSYKFVIDQGTSDVFSMSIRNEEVGANIGAYGTGSSYPREFAINATRMDAGSAPILRLAGQGGINFAVDLNTVRATIDSSGRLGIGTTSPDNVLHIVSTNANPIIQRTTDVGNNSTLSSLNFKNADSFVSSITNLNKSGSTKSSGSDGYEMRINNAGNGYISIFNDGTETARFTTSGLHIGGTGSANALDDYEEGTWTPAVSVGSITYGYTKYTKIGNIVHVRATISSVSNITSLSNFELTGLPFTAVGETSGGVMSRFISTSIGGDAYYWFIPNNNTKMAFYASANNSNFESIQHADITSTSTQFYIMATYRIE